MATLKPLSNASPGARFVVPASHTHLLTESEIFPSRVVGAKHMEPLELGEFTVWPIAERHQQDEVDEHGNHFYLGYVIRVNGVTVYHSGDTIYFRELADTLREFGIDVALINSNGRDWIRDENEVIGNMNYREAVEFAYTIQADMVVPMHYDLFKSNRENPAYFVDYLFTHHRDLKFHMFAVGERFIYYK
ncbi:MBL fold metallo-hydrolase [Alicyclobacillus macrosporangiidus]|uniref:MBL fold metallo-hydrolase n=1 Tax=Alicyclobacillus macrosporangiidus TaxID=392015 RepID=UPI000AB258DF|nr:MBL fold metallo-hydrolase [Alicyclobacillus macrosporangiidus]